MDIDKILESVGSKFSNYRDLIDSSQNLYNLKIPNISDEIEKINQERIQIETETKVEELRRHQEIIANQDYQLIEMRKQSLIHLESYNEVTKINENLQNQVSQLEESIKKQNEQLEFLKIESKANAKDSQVSKEISLKANKISSNSYTVGVISIIISVISIIISVVLSKQ